MTRCIFTVWRQLPEVFSAKTAGSCVWFVLEINVIINDGGEETRSVLWGGVERVVPVALVWRIAGKQERSSL